MDKNRVIDYDSMLEENRKRIDFLIGEDSYNPVTGKGSLIPRFELRIDPFNTVYLPNNMRELPLIKDILGHRTFRDYIISKNKAENKDQKLGKRAREDNFSRAVYALMELRCQYDFEYWAITGCKIVHKTTKKVVPFRLNMAQRIILQVLEEERWKGKTVYAQLVKARQFGGSTLVQMWMVWIQAMLHENWHSSIVTDVASQALKILNMYSVMAKNYPAELGTISLGGFYGSQSSRLIKERGCIISVGSMQKPDSLRSTDNSLIHCSEVGLWHTTKGKSPEDMLQTLLGSLTEAPDTAFIMESTAKGVGNFFHRTWVQNSVYRKIFVPWFKLEKNLMDLDHKKDFINTWDDYEWTLWHLGATIQGIRWYRHTLAAFNGDRWRMQSENPTTPEEAFSSTGNKYYPQWLLERHKAFITPPKYVGDIFGKTPDGKDALSELAFNANLQAKDNCLWAWSFPDVKEPYVNRYVVSVDIGGESDRADYSTINVIDRIGLLDGGALERAATWRGHISQLDLAWKAVQIAEFYEHALLVIECNSLEREEIEGTEGSHYLTVIDEIAPYYDNIYKRERTDRSKNKHTNLYGFHMNKHTKSMVMSCKKKHLETGTYLEYDERALIEATLMEIRPNGSVGNVEGMGNHDDIEVPTATAIYVSTKSMDAPYRRGERKSGAPLYQNPRGSIEAAI